MSSPSTSILNNSQDSLAAFLQDNEVADFVAPPPPPTPPPEDSDDEYSDILEEVDDSFKSKIGMGILTIFPGSNHVSFLEPSTYLDNPEDQLEQWCGKFEICPKTDKLHAHIFFKFKPQFRKTFNQIRNLVTKVTGKGFDLQRTKGRSINAIQCAINYVLKDESKDPNSLPYIWNGSCAWDQATWDKRSAKKISEHEQQRQWIESKPKSWTWAQILHESDESKALLCKCSWGKGYHDTRMATTERRTITNVIIMFGAGGTGKTTFARNWDSKDGEDIYERYYKRNSDDGHFWGGGPSAYRGQRVVHFEEFSGSEPISRMKEYIDVTNNGPFVNIKGSGVHLNHETVIITSNDHPASWYHKYWKSDPKQWYPFQRRVTQVWFFPETRPDGTPNRPASDGLPGSYVDMTDDWKAIDDQFDMALKHAEDHWPIRDIEDDGGGAFAPGFTLGEPAPKRTRYN